MLLVCGLGLLAACASNRPDSPGVAAAGGAAAGAARAPASESEPAYLRFKPESTGVEAIHDDGHLTYLTFAAPPGAELGFFDQDGRPLATSRVGRVVALRGLYRGILVRADRERASFVSPNPRRPPSPRPIPPEAAEYVEARAALESQAMLQQAMQHALAAAAPVAPSAPAQAVARTRADAVSASAPLAPVSPLAPVAQLAAVPSQSPDTREAALPEVTYLDAPSPGSPALPGSRWGADPRRRALELPLAAAHASVAVPAHGLVRVFFATASRTIVAPDDGLGLLLREAPHADEIRVTGFTDATGSRETNDALARARADAVVQILLRRGAAPDRIFSGGIGAADYIADNATEKGRALNRRVEVVLLRDGRPLAFGGASGRD